MAYTYFPADPRQGYKGGWYTGSHNFPEWQVAAGVVPHELRMKYEPGYAEKYNADMAAKSQPAAEPVATGSSGTGASVPAVVASAVSHSTPSSTSSTSSGFGSPGGAGTIDMSAIGGPIGTDPVFQSMRDMLVQQQAYYDEGMKALLGLPKDIDNWTTELNRQYRLGIDDITERMAEAANIHAARGTLGGTEAANLRSEMLSDLARDIQNKKAENLERAVASKISTIPQISQQGAIPMQLLRDYFDMQAGSDQAWGNIMFDILKAGYLG